MCNTTKQKIAAALRQQMMERPFQKITVQNLMDAAGMKRQSFYYHFQDTREVLMWICQQELMEPMTRSQLDFPRWICFGLKLIDSDRVFYRRMLMAAGPEFTREFSERVISPRMAKMLFGPDQTLDDNQRFALAFSSNSVSSLLCEFANSRRQMDYDHILERVRYTMELFGVHDDVCDKI